MVDQISEEGTLCTLGPLHESSGGECTVDDDDPTPARTDLRPYIDQVSPLLSFD